MNVNDETTNLYKMPPNSWSLDDKELKYYEGEITIVYSILRGETDSEYWMLSDFIENYKPKSKKEELTLKLAKSKLKNYNTEFTIEEPKSFPTLDIAQKRILDVFSHWKTISCDFTHMENLLYGFLTLVYSLLRVFDNVDAVIIPETCINKYSKNEQEYLVILCKLAHLNYKYARYLAEYDETDALVEKEYNAMLQSAFEIVPTGDIVNSLLAIQAVSDFFKNPNEFTSRKIHEIQENLNGRNVVKNILTLNHHGEMEKGDISWGWQYLPRVQISYETDFDMIEAIRPKNCKEPSDCLGEINMLFKTPAMIGVKTSEGNTLYWLISLLGESFEQKREVETINEALNKHIKLNQELVRNLSHSSANYLNSSKLARTGIELHKAENDNPTLDKLHIEGLSLLLQSEQELFLSRQLNSLVWRCSADINSLTQQLRGGLSKEQGEKIISPIEFAIKIVVARILFRDDDNRAEYIRKKLKKSDQEITKMQSSFMLDILAGCEREGKVIDWWKKNICDISLEISDVWKKLLIVKDKSFYDLIIEIVTEQILNVLSHGKLTQPIKLEFGQADEFKGRPRWTYVLCQNTKGERYLGGRGVGVSTLNETILLLNSNKKGIEITDNGDLYESKVWILASLTRAL